MNMEDKPIYEPIEEFSPSEIEAAIERNDADELLYAVLSASLYADDPEWAEGICLRLANHEHFNVRGNAVLGLAHIARIHGTLNKEKVRPIIVVALKDENEYVRGQAECTADDVNFFLKWRIRRSSGTTNK